MIEGVDPIDEASEPSWLRPNKSELPGYEGKEVEGFDDYDNLKSRVVDSFSGTPSGIKEEMEDQVEEDLKNQPVAISIVDRAQIVASVNSGTIAWDEFLLACKTDLVFFASVCCYVFNTKAKNEKLKDIPFIPRAFQRKYLRILQEHIDQEEDLLTDKSREMGVTWMVLIAVIWRWLFEDKFTAIVSSMTVEKIDRKGDSSTLFWKLEYLIEGLSWQFPRMVPKGFRNSEPYRTHLKLINPQNGAVITGESMGPNLGRSGRSRMMVLDEFAEGETQAESWASSSRTSDCRLVIFTPKGLNFAGRLATPKRGEPRKINKVTLHWMIDETKNHYEIYSGVGGRLIAKGNGVPNRKIYETHKDALPPVYPWYEDAKRRVGDDAVKIAQELDVNYDESADGIMYPQIERARFGHFPYDPSLAMYLAMDYGLSDETAMVWIQWDYRIRRFRVVDSFKAYGKTIKWYVPFITGKDYGLGTSEGGYTQKQVEKINSHIIYNGRYTGFFGDPAGKARNQVSNTSVIHELGKHGVYVHTNAKANSYEIRHLHLAQILPLMDFNEDLCEDLIDDIRSSRFKIGLDNRAVPIHGPNSHFRTAMEFFAVNNPHGSDGSMVTRDGMPIGSQTSENRTAYLPYKGTIIEIKPGQGGIMDARERLKELDSEEEDYFDRMTLSTGKRSRGGW